MKNILTLSLLLLTISSYARDTTILFSPINYVELFEIAQKEKKAVMIYFHFDGCGACVKMEKTAFKDPQVYDFYNANFINLEVNTLKGEGKEINKVYDIKLHPSFIFLDKEGKELHRIVGVFSPEAFLQHAQNALNSNKTLSNYKELYKNGKRDADFLYDYVYMLRDASELDSIVVLEYLNSIPQSELQQEKNIRFIYEFAMHNFKVIADYESAAFQFLYQNKTEFYPFFDKDQVHARIVWILNHTIYQAIEDKDEKTFLSAIELLKNYDNGERYVFKETDGRITGMVMSSNLVLSSKLDYYEKNGDKSKYKETLDAYLLKIWNHADELNHFAWITYEQSDDKEKIKRAIKCSIRSIELENSYSYNDTYAALLYKLGDYKKAMKQAEKAIELAKKNEEDFSETSVLMDKIKEAKK